MEAETAMNLFNSFWFELNILNKNSSSSSSKSTNSAENVENQLKGSSDSEAPKLQRIRTCHTRSMSDQSIATSFNHESLSPNSVLLAPKLQTIFSGKEVTDSEAEETPVVQHHDEVLLPEKKKNNNNGNNNSSSEKKKKKKKRGGSKSLSDLEFEELKGFMDLGFVFSEEDKNSSLASILPGLQRLGKKEEEQGQEEEDSDESLVSRPYLSEAWEFHGKRKKENPLMNWKVPSLRNEIDMKDSLRLWAHAVASTVR